MSDDIVFGVLNDATKKGLLTPDEKLSIKEMFIDGNGIVVEIAEDFKEDKDQKKFIDKLKDYLKIFNEDDDEDQQNKKAVEQLGSPEGEMLMNIKKKRTENKNQKKEEEDDFANIEECEDGLSPKVIFNKK